MSYSPRIARDLAPALNAECGMPRGRWKVRNDQRKIGRHIFATIRWTYGQGIVAVRGGGGVGRRGGSRWREGGGFLGSRLPGRVGGDRSPQSGGCRQLDDARRRAEGESRTTGGIWDATSSRQSGGRTAMELSRGPGMGTRWPGGALAGGRGFSRQQAAGACGRRQVAAVLVVPDRCGGDWFWCVDACLRSWTQGGWREIEPERCGFACGRGVWLLGWDCMKRHPPEPPVVESPVSGRVLGAKKRVGAGEVMEWQVAAMGRVNESLLEWFAELTGLRLWVYWRDAVVSAGWGCWFCPSARRCSEGSAAAPCAVCHRSRWAVNRSRPPAVPFVGACGKMNYWARLAAADATLAIFVLEARLVGSAASAERAPDPTVATVSPASFDRAVVLLRLLVGSLRESLEVGRLRHDLAAAVHRLHDLETAAVGFPEVSPPAELPMGLDEVGGERHAHIVVRRMLDFVHQHFRHPLSLGQVAVALGMNPSYLSSLFSHTVGIPFHVYLDQLRMTTAMELLVDPRNRVSDVACAVGYASEDWFRHAFKAHTGYCPSEWRDRQGRH